MKPVFTAFLMALFLLLGMSCTSTDSELFAERDLAYANFVESAKLEETEAITNIVNVRWNALTNKYLVVNANAQRDEFYLVEFRNTCYRLRDIDVIARNPIGRHYLSKNERIFMVAENTWPCQIQAIYPLSTAQHLEILQMNRTLHRGQLGQAAPPGPPTATDIMSTYIEVARASYGDSLESARLLDTAIADLLAAPSAATLYAARDAWRAARIPYQQTEAYRFGNGVVDAWEGRVNAWPLDEGLIDYVAAAYGEESDNNYFYTANIIANPLVDIGGISVDATNITPLLLAETLHEIDGVEANVATGYHAIEFLLWGQDLNGTNPGAGNRPYTDFSLTACSNGNCERRRDYLAAASALLVADLEEMLHNWQDGAAVADLRAKGLDGGLATILTGMGSLAYGELAGERMRLALLLRDPEEEHDCFSDNTHWSHYYDALGIRNVYRGEYTRTNGQRVEGASIEDLLLAVDPALHAEMSARLEATHQAMQAIVDAGEAGNTYDVLIASGNLEGERLINDAVAALIEQTRTLEKVITALQLQNVSIEGSTSLPEAP